MAIQTVVHFELQQFHCRSLPHGGAYYLARIPVQIVLLNEGYHYQTRSLFEVKQAEYIGVQ